VIGTCPKERSVGISTRVAGSLRLVTDANSKLVWFRRSYGVGCLANDVSAAFFVKENRTVLPDDELVYDYS
jgi:hypothetical protein